MVGWTSRQIPARFRVALWEQCERWELEPWRELLKDKSRELPGDVTLIFWQGLPLALWIPACHLTKFDFNPN